MKKYYQITLGILLGVAIIVLMISFCVEYILAIPPCTLCKLQRIPYLTTGVLALIGLFTPLKRFILRFIQVCFLAGLLLATYHSCIQFGFLGSPCQKKQMEKTAPSWKLLKIPPPCYNGAFSFVVLIGTEIVLMRTRKKG